MSRIRVFLLASVLSRGAGLWPTPVGYSSETRLKGAVNSPPAWATAPRPGKAQRLASKRV